MRGEHLRKLLFFLWLAIVASLYLYQEKPTGLLAGKVVDAQGNPIAGALITLQHYPRQFKTRTTQDGNFKFAVPVGQYSSLYVKQKGYQQHYEYKTFKVVEGQTISGLEFPLKKLAPSLSLYLANNIRTPRQKVSMDLSGAYVGKVYFSLYQMEVGEFLAKSQTSLSELESLPLKADTPGAHKVKDWEYEIAKPDQPEFSNKIWPEIPEKGLFILRAEADSLDRTKVLSAQSLVNRTELGAVLKRDDQQILVYVSHFQNKKPVAGAEVLLVQNNHELKKFSTDAQGLSKIPLHELASELVEGSLPVIIHHGDYWAFQYVGAPGGYYDEGEDEEPLVIDGKTYQPEVFLYTERPVYRPAQTVYFKGIARYRGMEGAFRVPDPSDTIEVTVTDISGDSLLEETFHVNELGSFSGQITLEEEPPLGFYMVRAEYKGKEFTKEFEVQEYRKPEFKVEVVPQQTDYFGGDKVRLQINSTYYFGAPALSTLQYSVFLNDYSGGWEEGGGDGYGEVVAEGEIATDAKGQATVEFTAKKVPFHKQYSVSVTATDSTNRQVNTSFDFSVWAADLKIKGQPKAYVYYVDQPIDLELTVSDLKDKPLAKLLNVVVERENYDAEAGTYGHVSKAKFQVQTDGQGKATHPFTVSQAGYYRLNIQGEDTQGRKLMQFAYVWVTGKGKEEPEPFQLEKAISITCDKEKYQPTDKALCVLVSPIANLPVLVTLEGGKLHRAWVEQVDGYSKTLEIPLSRDYLPNVAVLVTAIGDKALYEDRTELSINPDEKLLKVDIHSDKSEYKPGETVAYEVQLKDLQGNPVVGEVSLGVVDESIYALRSDSTDIIQHFYGNQYNRVVTTHTFSGYLEAGLDKFDADKARKNFQDTAFWVPTVQTDVDGRAHVSVNLPDNLTTWRATVIAHDANTLVGQNTQKILAKKPIIVRLATPRFYIEGDQGWVRAVIHNYTDTAQELRLAYDLKGMEWVNPGQRKEQITIPPQGQVDMDLQVLAKQVGEASLGVQAKNAALEDAVLLKVPVLPYGIPEHQYFHLKVPGAGEADITGEAIGQASVKFNVPRATDPNKGSLSLTLDGHYIVSMLGGIGYLIDYPYGCVEQTMSRLLPSIYASSIDSKFNLLDDKLKLKLEKVIKKGLRRIYTFQHYDGGWGWWKNDPNDPYMTAYALYGLLKAKKAGYEIKPEVLTRGREALKKLWSADYQPQYGTHVRYESDRLYMNYVLRLAGEKMPLLSQDYAKPTGFVSNIYAALIYQLEARKKLSQESIANAVRQLICKQGECSYYYEYTWAGKTYRYYSFREMALLLMAMVNTDYPDKTVKDNLVQFLLSHREGNYWRSTLDTAHMVYALYTLAQSELPPQPRLMATLTLNDKELLKLDNPGVHLQKKFEKIALQVPANQLKVENKNPQPLYISGDVKYFVKGGGLAASDQGINLIRNYFRYDNDKQAWVLLVSGDKVHVGDHIAVDITFSMNQDGHKLVLEDPLPAGFEVVTDSDLLGNYGWYSDMMVRDEKIALFIYYYHYDAKAPQKTVRYILRPERAGEYHILPTQGQAMYDPEVRGTGNEFLIKVE